MSAAKNKKNATGLRLHHIAINVRNLHRQQLFYQRILRLRLCAKQKDQHGKLRAIWLMSGTTIIMLEKVPLQSKMAKPTHLLAFQIHQNDRPLWLSRFKRHKVKVFRQSSYSLYFADPEGNRLALSHYPQAVKTA